MAGPVLPGSGLGGSRWWSCREGMTRRVGSSPKVSSRQPLCPRPPFHVLWSSSPRPPARSAPAADGRVVCGEPGATWPRSHHLGPSRPHRAPETCCSHIHTHRTWGAKGTWPAGKQAKGPGRPPPPPAPTIRLRVLGSRPDGEGLRAGLLRGLCRTQTWRPRRAQVACRCQASWAGRPHMSCRSSVQTDVSPRPMNLDGWGFLGHSGPN